MVQLLVKFLKYKGASGRDANIDRLMQIREFHRDQMKKASALIKVLQDEKHSERKRVFRAEKIKANGKGGIKQRGRKERWPGRCIACLKRFLQEPGGPVHNVRLCQATQREIKSKGAFVRKCFSKKK